MNRSIRSAAFLALAGLTALAGCGGSSTPSASPSNTAAGTPAATASNPSEALARALLAPQDLSNLGGNLGNLVTQEQDNSTDFGNASLGPSLKITFVSGDPACKDVLASHPGTGQAWARVFMGSNASPEQQTVAEEIDSLDSLSDAERVMQENRDQLASCHTFVGDNQVDQQRLTFSHEVVSVPKMGEDTVAHQLNGRNASGSLVWNIVEIRSGSDVIFIYDGATRGTVTTTAIASKAMSKYTATPR